MKNFTLTLVIAFLAISTVACSPLLADNNHNHGHASSKSASALPAWELTDAKQQIISSDQFAGRPYVLVLHLGKGCLRCAKQLHAFGDRVDSFRKLGVEVVGVSTDNSQQLAKQLTSFGKSFSLEHLASDHELNLFRGLNAFDQVKEKPLHGTVLVDAAGHIRWSNISAHPYMEIDELLAEAKLVSVGATTKQEDDNPDRPRIFLDKSERIINYQLNRLNNERLLMVIRKMDDKKYVPVWRAILTRGGMETPYRNESLNALMKLGDADAATVLIESLNGLKANTRSEKTASRELANMLLKLKPEELKTASDQLVAATGSDNEVLRETSFAALLTAGQTAKAIESSQKDETSMISWLRAMPLVRDTETRNGLRAQVLNASTKGSLRVRRVAILAMQHFTTSRKETWSFLMDKMSQPKLRDAAIQTMLAIPVADRDQKSSGEIVEQLLQLAEETPPGRRTRQSALLGMQLAEELISVMPEDDAVVLRKRMSEVSVRVVRVKTVKEEMRYDVPYFAAQAGRPLQIVLENEDLMPHNLIVCKPGTLKRVAADGLAAGPKNGLDGKQYVPNTGDVLFATDMVQANEQERLTFTVPRKPGAYPFVCTFPQHWSRMYGVMVVVRDLAAWEKNPVKPKDPIGNKRKLVKKWTVDDFKDDIEVDLSKRSLDAGKRIFTEATCAQCHRIGDFGGAGANVGPELDELYKRWKQDRGAAIQQMLDPSSHIDPKYKMFIIATDDGRTSTGLIVSQNDEVIELLESGSVSKTTKILKEEIEEMAESKKSIMPKALLDNFTKEEILDLVNYLESNQK